MNTAFEKIKQKLNIRGDPSEQKEKNQAKMKTCDGPQGLGLVLAKNVKGDKTSEEGRAKNEGRVTRPKSFVHLGPFPLRLVLTTLIPRNYITNAEDSIKK